MIEIRNLSAGYDGMQVLHGVSMAFPTGQVTALLGPNGCGKSTLVKTILGLLPEWDGEILYDGVSIRDLSVRQVAQKAAYLAQARNIPSITARRMVLHGRFPYLGYPRRYRPEDYEIVRRALKWADAEELAGRSMAELSGGQRQKVYLAMALAQDTQTIFMDEPTTYLDVRHQLDVMAVSRRLAEMGRAAVLVLHDLSLALREADQLAVLDQGGLRQVGTAEEIFLSGVLDRVFGVTVHRVHTDSGWQYYYG